MNPQWRLVLVALSAIIVILLHEYQFNGKEGCVVDDDSRSGCDMDPTSSLIRAKPVVHRRVKRQGAPLNQRLAVRFSYSLRPYVCTACRMAIPILRSLV